MVNPGAFSGSRRAFLTSQKVLYATAVTENHVADTVADIQRQYFKRYPMSLPHNEEPSDEWLSKVDDNAPDDDLLPPSGSLLDKTVLMDAQAAYDEQVKTLKYRKDQISRRLAYEYAKGQTSTGNHIEAGTDDPMAILMAKLTGVSIKKPRLRTGHALWGQRNRHFVDPIYNDRVKTGNIAQNKRAALRMSIYKECFDELNPEDRKEYEDLAKTEHRDALAKIKHALNDPPSQNPEDRQNILNRLPTFIQPILEIISAHTGWKATLLVGGPEPADQGRLNVMSFHAGETKGNIKMNFGRAERSSYKMFITPIFGSFLKKCYTVEECRAAALSDPSVVSLAEVLRIDGGEFNVDSAEGSSGYVKVSRTPNTNQDFNEPHTPIAQTSSTSTTYQIPLKIGPPIHAQRKQGTPSTSSLSPRLVTAEPLLLQTTSSGIAQPDVASICHSAAPSPVPSPNASPMRSLVHSPTYAPLPTPLESVLSVTPALHSQPLDVLSIFDHPMLQVPAAQQPSASPQPSIPPIPILQSLSPQQPNLPILMPHRPSIPPISTLEVASTQLIISPTSMHEIRSPLTIEQLPHTQTSHPYAIPQASAVPATPLLVPVTRASTTRKRLLVEDEGRSESSKHNGGSGTPRKRLRSSRGHTRGEAVINTTSHVPASVAAIEPTSDPVVQSMAPLTPGDLSGCPDWFLKAYEMFLSKDLGPDWMQLVRAWAHFEKAECYEEQGKLGTKSRPPCVADWIARARAANYNPKLGPLPLFAKAFDRWWIGLQPEWRVEGAGEALHRQASSDDDLEVLRRPGKNGLLSVLAALFFWGISAAQDAESQSQLPWKLAIDEVCWVIQTLATR